VNVTALELRTVRLRPDWPSSPRNAPRPKCGKESVVLISNFVHSWFGMARDGFHGSLVKQ